MSSIGRLLKTKLSILLLITATAFGQSIVSGDVTGTVTDPSGAVVNGAAVTLKNNDTGVTQTTKTNNSGAYRFAFQKPGSYVVSVAQSGFQTSTRTAMVAIGQVTRADIKLQLGQSSQTVEVTAETPLIQTENGNTQASFNTAQIAALPSPGGDITYVAQTAPGIAVNTSSGGGYGNFTSNGIPATANLFTVNGNDEMDPYLNLNNSGASNLTLGANELSEATVTTNGYTGEFGRNAGAQINYATKSGTNNLHGNATYSWSGAALNARDWFNNGPAPNTHDHQWSASAGGPIFKNKTFFFVDAEGIKYTLPTSNEVFIPSQSAQATTIANLTAAGMTASIPFYQQMFNLWNNAPGAANAVVADPTDTNIASFHNAVTNSAHEWILIGRVDHQFSNNDKVFFRYKTDHGLQPTFTDPISPVFNAESVQPSYEGQANWAHTMGAAVNQFILSGSYYSAIFKSVNQAAATSAFPYSMFAAGPYTSLGGENYAFPQGRNVGQYQIVDDFSLTRGKHSMKFGINFRHDNVTDYVYSSRSVTPLVQLLSEKAFMNGLWDVYQQRFPSRSSQPFVLSSLGFYFQDQWRINNHLSVTLALRGDHNSNPSCATNCYALTRTSFSNMIHDNSIPYNQVISNNVGSAFHELENVAWQPRFGFAFTPGANGKTVIRGGIGFFSDVFPGTLAELFSRNTPQVNSFTVQNGAAAPGETGSAQTAAALANAAVNSVFANGGTVADLVAGETAAGVVAAFPNMNVASARFTNPKFLKWNIEFAQGFGSRDSISINYNGNHGRDLIIDNPGVNAFCTPDRCGTAVNGIPSTVGPLSSRQSPIDGRFGTVSEYTNSGTSDYDGVTVSYQRRYTTLQLSASYTWSHALDDVSNGGLEPYSNNDSIIYQINPTCLECQNRGNADYDIRHYFQASYTWTPGWKFSKGFLNNAFGGWTLSNTYYFRTGLPFSVYDSTLSGTIRNYGSDVLLNTTGAFSCGRPGTIDNRCFNEASFGTITTSDGTIMADPAVGVNSNQRRNQFRGPNYFDTDLSVSKNIPIKDNLKLGIGLNAFNILNHPNFANPVNDLGASGFGTIINTVSPPTSPFGAFAGASSSGRVLQVQAKILF